MPPTAYECQTCHKVFDHWTPYVAYETIRGKRVRRLITGNDARGHEGANPGHRCVKVIGPRI